MADKEIWVTYAWTDTDGIKALVLGRSLRQSITRRQLAIFISDQLSWPIVNLLQDEFDICVKLDGNEFKDADEFSLVAQAHSYGLKRFRKFVFLDCNSLVLKNSDELFRELGMGFVTKSDGKRVASIIVGKPSAHMKKALLNGKTLENFPPVQLGEKYCVQLDLLQEFPVTGKEIKILHFVQTHPLDLILQKENKIAKMAPIQQCLIKNFLDLTRDDELFCETLDNGTSFSNKVKEIKALLNKPSSTIMKNPDPKIIEDLKDSVAIVGMSFRLPGANTIDEFWDLLINGKDGIIKVPDGRWNKDQCFIRLDNTKDTQAGFLKCPIDMIDGKFFGMNAAELAYMDPQQRLTLQVVWEGLENAGISGSELKDTLTGVFGGWWRNDYKEMLQEAGLNETEFFRAYMGNALGTLTGRISHYLELTGPSISTESGCSTSMVAVDMACNSLREENCDLALAVGVNLLIHPFSIEAMNAVVAMDGHCKTFDAKADGFGRAEGCAVLVLKRFAEAAADGDKIWGVIRGSAVVQEGASRSLGTPTVQCEALAMELALKNAGVEPKDVSFVETHGTGTPVGDPLEVAAVAKVYSKNRKDILTIGSVKTNIGHTESVSGIAGIVKTVLSLQNEMIPPHLHLESLNPEINLESIPAQIPMSPMKWQKVEGKPRIAGVSSFGITGTDAHVILQETPETISAININETLPLKFLTLSAKSAEGLEEYIETFKNFLETTEYNIEDIEYTSHVARGHFSNRLCIIGSTKEEIIQKFEKKSYEIQDIPSAAPKLCFIFTGQGSQYVGMAKDLYDNSLVFRSHFDYCESILKAEYGLSIKEAVWSDAHALSRSLYSQTSIFCIEFCLLKLWESFGIKAHSVVGHSLGEFCAAVAAGILTFEDALKLVVTRSKLIDSLPTGKMLVIKEELSSVQKLMKVAFEGKEMSLDIAAINTSEQTVLAGDENAVQHFAQFCSNNKIKTHVLDSTHAFHSRHMDPILEEYKTTADNITFSPQKCEFISGMKGKLMKVDEINADYWVEHTREKVNFLEASKIVLEGECTHFLEIGPQPVLSAMILANSDFVELTNPITCLPSIRKQENNWTTLLNSLSKLYLNGFQINWANYHRYSSGKKVQLPSYPFQLKSHWVELKNNEAIPIHPLVGTPVPNPSSIKIFKSEIDVLRVTFLKDHVLGNKIIFPGAGFVEMCLVSGHSAIQCTEGNYSPPTSALTIEDFLIEAPLCLNEQEKNQLQVVVSTEDNGETRATIYSKLTLDKETHKWIKHASGLFSPFASKWDGDEEFHKDSLEQIKIRCAEKLSTEFNYSKIEEFGLKFGPIFQTIKGCWKGEKEVLFEMNVGDNPKRYICHPAMIDSMFQAVMICMNPQEAKLQVPISISKFICSGKIAGETVYVYCKMSDKKEAVAIMMNMDGGVVSVMIGAEFMETTVGNVMSLLEAQRTPYPSMYEDVWRDQLGPFERRTKVSTAFTVADSSKGKEYKKHEESGKYNKMTEQEKEFFAKFHELNGLYMVKALQDINLELQVGEHLEVETLTKELGIQEGLKRFLSYILMELVQDGYFKLINPDPSNPKFEVLKVFPEKTSVISGLKQLNEDLSVFETVDVKSVGATAQHLGDILTGRQSALSILFPENGEQVGPAEAYYLGSKMSLASIKLSDEIIPEMVKTIRDQRGNSKTIVRCLEIGAGTGSFTKNFLPHFLNDGAAFYEYTYTDISPAFFPKGEKVFENSKMKVNYKLLNIEEDPTSQGFIPHHYDMIFASFVIHATKDIEKSMANARNLLREGGKVILTELTRPYRGINLIFGTLEGFWRFEDQIRPYHCELDTQGWEKVLTKLGFQDFSAINFFNSNCAIMIAEAGSAITPYYTRHLPPVRKSWIIFSESGPTSKFLLNKLSEMGNRVILAKRSSDKTHLSQDGVEVYDVGNENPGADVLKVFSAIRNEQELEGVIYLWTFDIDKQENVHDYSAVCQPFLYICKLLASKDLGVKLFVVTKGNMGIDDNKVEVPTGNPIIAMAKVLQNENQSLIVKCVDLDPSPKAKKVSDECLAELFTLDGEINIAYRGNRRLVKRFIPWKVPNTCLKFPKSNYFHLKLPSSLALSDLRFAPMELPPLQENQVEVQVKAYGLNFRDLFAIMKPDPMFENMNTVGIDYAGIVTSVGSQVTKFKVGDGVFGASLNGGAMPSHIHEDEQLLIEVPNQMTFWEAATLPAVACTAYVCLIEIAKLTENDTILIHTASGGVGLCAVQIAQHKGCRIIATAGSVRKRDYLKNLGIQHVFHSRNTNYEHEIRAALNGGGVDVVLNSLTGEGFKEASLSVCNENARFIEMSKLNVWSKEEVKALRADVQYEIVDLSASSAETMKKQLQDVKSTVEKSTLKPIPYVKFDAGEVREALTYLQNAKHIGKIVCVMPDLSSTEQKSPLFNERSCYMITGGLGGIGLEVCKWMAKLGAKHILLVGRNPPKNKTEVEINKLRSEGINVQVIQCDVGDREQLVKVLEEIKEEGSGLPPLRGIMHAAGVLTDAFLQDQSWENYEKSFNPKVRGGWNLHELTLNYPLEHFVVFSSVASSAGSVAQSNHSAANCYLDALVHYRNSIGLPATTINWGQWGQVGVAADMELVGIRPFTALQGVSALEKTMRANREQTTVLEAEFQIIRKGLPTTKRYFEELKTTKNSSHHQIGLDADKFWKEYDATKTREEKFEVLRKNICALIRATLKMEEEEVIDNDANFQDMGMDSLMMIEMKNGLQASVGKRVKITVSSVRDCKTVNQLATKLVELISGVEELPVPTKEELIELVKEDSLLPEDIKPEVECTIKSSEIRSVLITGVTGNFGPYILREISSKPEIEKIYCIMRDNRLFSPKERLKQMLTEKKLINQIDMEKIECIAGDISKPLMGLTKEIYEDLAAKVDGIFNLSVKASFDEYYCKSEHSSHSRIINVVGTKQILKFAIEKRTKHVFHASTTISTSRCDADGNFSESFPIEGEMDNQPNNSYSFSKFIQDRLMASAVERGIPCKVFRFPFMGGDSELGGNVSILDNHLMMRMMAYMYLGVMPAKNFPVMIIPVHVCASLSVKIFFNDESPFEMYNVTNPLVEDELLLEEVSKEFGHPVEAVEPQEFLERVNKLEQGKDEIWDMIKRACSKHKTLEDMEENAPQVVSNWLAGQKNVFLSKKLNKFIEEYPNCMEPAWVILKKDLKHAKDSGIFAKIGLK